MPGNFHVLKLTRNIFELPSGFCDLGQQVDLYTKTILVPRRCQTFQNKTIILRYLPPSLICAIYTNKGFHSAWWQRLRSEDDIMMHYLLHAILTVNSLLYPNAVLLQDSLEAPIAQQFPKVKVKTQNGIDQKPTTTSSIKSNYLCPMSYVLWRIWSRVEGDRAIYSQDALIRFVSNLMNSCNDDVLATGANLLMASSGEARTNVLPAVTA